MKVAIHGFRFFRRELFQPEMRLVFLALLVTVTSMATVGFLTDRIAKALQRQSNELLGADLLVTSTRAIPDSWRTRAGMEGLRTAYFQEFKSVLIGKSDTTLTEVKAVTDGYPLRGKLLARDEHGKALTNAIPSPGTVWVEGNLLRRQGLLMGDAVRLGKSVFKLTALIEHEPDRGGNLFALAPRAMMNYVDLSATGLVGEGSRVTHSLLLAGDYESLQSYRQWLQARLGQHYQIQSVRDSRPEVDASLGRAERFLALSLVVTIILANLAIWVAMQTWVQKRLLHTAVLRTFGLTRYQILSIYLSQLSLLVLLACAASLLLAWLLQSLFAAVIQSQMVAVLPAASLKPAVVACTLGLSLVVAFSLPAYWRLASVSPMRVLRSMPDQFDSSDWSILWGLLVLAGVLGWLTADAALLALTMGGLVAAMMSLLLLSYILLVLLRRTSRKLPAGYRLGVHALVRHRRETLMSISVFGLSFVFVILLTLVRSDLLNQWRESLPPDTPNVFLINIQASEVADIDRWLSNNGMKNISFSPTVRARLMRINSRAVSSKDYDSSRMKRLATREFYLSWSDKLPSHNQLSAGEWWTANPAGLSPQWSVESGIADGLGVSLGDELRFDAAGRIVKGRVSSFREVSWDSFKVNFFVIGTPPMLETLPSRYISSFYLPSDKNMLMNELVRQYPSVAILDVDALMLRVRNVIDKISYAAEAAFVFTLAAATLLMIAMVMSGRHLRQRENALFRAMGATRATLNRAQRTEFVLIGACAGLVAVVLSNMLAWLVSVELLGIDFQFNFPLAFGVMLAGVVLMMITGWGLLKNQQNQTPLSILRQS